MNERFEGGKYANRLRVSIQTDSVIKLFLLALTCLSR